MPGLPVDGAEPVEERHDGPYAVYQLFADWGLRALITTRRAGSFGTASDEPVAQVLGRWDALRARAAADGVGRLATARQVHGADLLTHAPGWQGWLRGPEADGHVALERGTACAVTVADCVPVFVAHPSGAVALLHSGWRGTAARIIERAVAAFAERNLAPADLRVLLGPAVCGGCYEVSPDVYAQLTGRRVGRPTPVDVRAVIAGHARALGVRRIFASGACTRCDNATYYSHRAGDGGRQLGVFWATPGEASRGRPAIDAPGPAA